MALSSAEATARSPQLSSSVSVAAPLHNGRGFEVWRASEHEAREGRGQYHKRFAEAECPPAAAVGYHLVMAKTPVRSPKTGTRASADQAM